nr:hypothetical protein [Tanacetum cinerariifolium]
MVSGKDSSNPLMADNLPKNLWYSTHHVALMKSWLVQKQMTLESIEYLPSEEIFTELSRTGYEKPSTKLTFYKAFFLPQWMFLIHTILQCMSTKRTSWNEFSSSMALTIICLSTGRKFNFSKYIFNSLVRNVDSSTKFYMYPQFLQLMIRAQVYDLSLRSKKYSSPALTQKVFANMRRVGKGFYRVDTPLFKGMIVVQQDDDVAEEGAASVAVDDVPAVVAKDVVVVEKTAEIEENADVQRRQAESQTQIYQIDLEHADKVLSMQDYEVELAELQEDEACVRELEAELNKNINWDDVIDQVWRKEKEDNDVMRYQALKRKPQTEAQARKNMMIYLGNMAGFKMDYFKGMSYDDIRLIFEKKFNSNKLDKEVEELKKHLQIVPNDKDDVYTEATPLARKEFDKEDLEVLWQLVKERFASSKPKNFSDDFLLTTLTYMFKKLDVQAQVWKNQRTVHGLVKVKS